MLPPEPRRRVQARVRWSVTLLFFANGAGYGAWAATVASIKEQVGASDGALGAALLCLAMGAIVSMPIIGWLGARGVTRLPSLTTAALALCLPLPALVGSVPALAATLLALGASAGTMDVCMNARASRLEQGWGAAIMSSFHAAFSLGGLAGTAVVGGALAIGAGAFGGLGTISALLLAALLVHLAWDPAPELAAKGGRALSWPTAAVAGLGVLCGLAFFCEGAVADWSGVFLRDVAGYGNAGSAVGFGAFSLAMVTARLLGDRAVRRFDRGTMLAAGSALAAVGVVFAAVWPSAGPVGFFLTGLGAANAAPILFSAAGRSGPNALAAVATLGYAGMLIGPPVIGGLAQIGGLRLALQALTVASLTIALGARRLVG